jgi:hypothetical protein
MQLLAYAGGAAVVAGLLFGGLNVLNQQARRSTERRRPALGEDPFPYHGPG